MPSLVHAVQHHASAPRDAVDADVGVDAPSPGRAVRSRSTWWIVVSCSCRRDQKAAVPAAEHEVPAGRVGRRLPQHLVEVLGLAAVPLADHLRPSWRCAARRSARPPPGRSRRWSRPRRGRCRGGRRGRRTTSRGSSATGARRSLHSTEVANHRRQRRTPRLSPTASRTLDRMAAFTLTIMSPPPSDGSGSGRSASEVVDGGDRLAGDQVDDPAGERDRVVGDALVVAAEQRDVDGGLDAVRPGRRRASAGTTSAAAGPSPRRPPRADGRPRRRARR